MEITPKPPLPTPLLAIANKASNVDLSFLKPGQLLDAVVISPPTRSDHTLSIKVNDRIIKVVSDLQLAQGTKINLKVELKEGQLMLRLITPPDNKLQTPQQALRLVLPKQQPMQPLFTQLARIASQLEAGPAAKSQKGAVAKATPQITQSVQKSAGSKAAPPVITTSNGPLLTTDKRAVTASDTAALPPLPPKVRKTITALLKQLPSNEKLTTPEGLKQAVNNSGLFFENRLQQGGDKASLQGDLKTILFRIAFLLRQSVESLPTLPPRASTSQQGANRHATPQGTRHRGAPPAQQAAAAAKQAETTSLLQMLGQQSESALARVQMHQLTTLSSQQQGEQPVINLELPLFNGKESDLLKLQIQRENRRNNGETEACWSVTLTLDNERFGEIRAVVSLIAQKVSTTFWCEQPETQQLFQQHLQTLREQIKKQGLELGRTQAFIGMPPQPDGPDRPQANDNLINIQA